MTYSFTTIITKEGRWFVAHCLELGVVSQGSTARSAEKNLKEAVELYLEDVPKRKLRGIVKPLIRTLRISHA